MDAYTDEKLRRILDVINGLHIKVDRLEDKLDKLLEQDPNRIRLE